MLFSTAGITVSTLIWHKAVQTAASGLPVEFQVLDW
jgi:hypothetical protein